MMVIRDIYALKTQNDRMIADALIIAGDTGEAELAILAENKKKLPCITYKSKELAMACIKRAISMVDEKSATHILEDEQEKVSSTYAKGKNNKGLVSRFRSLFQHPKECEQSLLGDLHRHHCS